MNKFLVVSYDSDEQQWFYDVVFAETKDAAQLRVSEIRDYVIDTDAFDMAELAKMADYAQTVSLEESENWLQEIAS